MKHRISLGVLAAAALAGLVIAAPAMSQLASGAPNKWENIQVGVTYRLYQPGKTLGFKLNKLKTLSCGKGHDVWAAGTYGTYKGALGTNTKGFALYEGHPICSNPAESTQIKGNPPLKIMGAVVRVGVYCSPPKTCTISQGVKNGFTLQWTAKPSGVYKKTTQMQLDSSHLTFSQVLKIANGLKKV